MLCLELRIPHPKYLSSVLTLQDFYEWRQYYTIAPFGDYRRDLRTAQVVSMHTKERSLHRLTLTDLFQRIAEDPTIGMTPEEFNAYLRELERELFADGG